jgi:hypothetical protein
MRKWLQRKPVAPIHILPGDSIELRDDGKLLAREPFTEEKTIDEVGVFEDQTEDGKDMTCGAFIERHKQ